MTQDSVVGMDASMLIFLLLMIAMFIFMSWSSNKKMKQRQAELDKIKVGDKIETVGRIYGEVVGVDGDKLTINVGVGSLVKIQIHKEGVARLVDSVKE